MAKLKERLLIGWHRLILGRTAKPITPPLWAVAHYHCGTAYHLAYEIARAAREALPVGIAHEIATRHAADVPRGAVRIVLETA